MVAVSLILISYNSAEFIAKSLGSAMTQTLEDMEIIVVDNASTDGCLAIIKQMASSSSKPITIIENNTNVGLGYGRNCGLDAACGKYVAFLDDDDWLEPDAMEKALKAATAANCDVLQYEYYVWKNGVCKTNGTVQRIRSQPPAQKELMDLSPAAWNKLYLRAHLDKWKIRFHQGYAEDVDWSLRVICVTERFEVLKEPLLHYRRRPNSMAHRPGKHHLEVAERYSIVADFLDQNPDISQKWQPYIAYHCLKRLCLQYRGSTRKPLRPLMLKAFHTALLRLDPDLHHTRQQFPLFYRLHLLIGLKGAFTLTRIMLLKS